MTTVGEKSPDLCCEDAELLPQERSHPPKCSPAFNLIGRTIWMLLVMLLARFLVTTFVNVIHWSGTAVDRKLYEAPLAVTLNGSYSGIHNPTYSTDHFLGIPFAQPPIARLRFHHPQPLNKGWSGVRTANEYAKSCYQRSANLDHVQDEDCLALNVVRPAGVPEQKLPVAVWIHGGGYVTGATMDKPYNLSFVVQNSVSMGKPIIGVSIAYRLSGFGFMDSHQLRAEGVTNLGMRDQRLALQWIKENIAAFGGDPNKVTIWGESAGAGAVGIHLIAYGGRDDELFRSAIGESGAPLLLGPPGYDFAQRQEIFDKVVQSIGCQEADNVLACMRLAEAEQLHQALRGYAYWPYEDGDIIRGSQHDQLMQGQFIKVPYLLGTNTDEGVLFAQAGINTDADFEAFLNSTGAQYDVVKNLQLLYPNIPALGLPAGLTGPLDTTIGHQYKRTVAYGGDWWMNAPRRLAMEQWAAYNTPAYSYRFNTIVNPSGPSHGVGHFEEVAFVFNNVNGEGYAYNPFEGKPQSYRDLSKLMCRMWISFVHDGNPNNHLVSGTPKWPSYENGDGGHGQNFVFTAGSIGVENDVYRGAAMAYMNTLWKRQYGK